MSAHGAEQALAGIATAYVELFQNVPLLVQLFIWYFVLPELLLAQHRQRYSSPISVLQQFLAPMVSPRLSLISACVAPSRCRRHQLRCRGAEERRPGALASPAA